MTLDALAAVVVAAGVVYPVYGPELRTTLFCVVGLAAVLAFVGLFRGYDPKELGDGATEFQALIRAGLSTAALLMSLSYAFHAEVSRTVVFVGVPLWVLLAVGGRHFQRTALYRERDQREAMMRTLVVGDAEDVGRVVRDLVNAPQHGFQVVGLCLPSIDDQPPVAGVPVMGAVADVPQVVADHAAEVVVVTGSRISGEGLRRLSWALSRVGAQLIVAPDLVEVTGPRLTLRPTAGLALLEVEVGAPRSRMVAKNILDKVASVILLLAALPVITAAALAVKVTSPGPIFYCQTRVGVDGRTFTMWKLRSMYVDAEERRKALLENTDRDGPMFKMHADPRVTPVGRFLRRFSIDELPQLFNVVKGDMSLVGPRPPLVDEVATYPDPVHRRLHVRPGLTGLWQVSGRADLSWEESVRLDLRYVDNWSLAMDLLILWKTARAVVSGSGAY